MNEESAHLLQRAVAIRPPKLLIAILIMLLPLADVYARVGGGQSYGGGGDGGGDGDGGAIIWLVFELLRFLIYLTIEYPAIGIPVDIIVIAGVVFYFARSGTRRRKAGLEIFSTSSTVLQPGLDRDVTGPRSGFTREFDQLRKFDPNFSEIVFTDFCYALYAKSHHARGQGAAALELMSPYLSPPARNTLIQRNSTGLKEVKGIIVGAMPVVNVRGVETPTVRISVVFEANYTEVVETNDQPSEMSYYVRERWDFERNRDVLSPPPAQATALHCPRCGAPLQRDTVGACAFCGTKIESGEFQWYVRGLVLLDRQARGPLLTSDVAEIGTDFPSVMQTGFGQARAAFESNNPSFSWGEFQARARMIFDELQAAWSSLNWERARPHETDNIFQMHQYWIEAYKRQGLRNMLDQCSIIAMQPVKIKDDAFYNAITMRIWAQGYDYTVDANGRVVSGSKNDLRRWSEYWTFIRNRQAQSIASKADLNCPNCGAPLKVNVAGICEFCGGKITSGEFDWVLSRIEQDESYSG